MIDDAQLFGQIITDLPLKELTPALQRAGMDAAYGESTHKGASVTLASVVGDADCQIQPCTPGEYLVCNAGGERAALEDLARTLSAALAGLGLPHRLELSDRGEAMDVYLHLGMPLEGDGVME